MAGMHLGLHLPQLDLDGSGLSLSRLTSAARAARDAGFGSLCANDHVLFAGPWLDGLVALTAVVEASGDLELVTTVAVPALRHPLLLAKALVALDLLSGGRVVAGIGAGSSTRRLRRGRDRLRGAVAAARRGRAGCCATCCAARR